MTAPEDTGTHDPPERARYRVPVGLPLRSEGRREGAIISVLVHALIIAFLIIPVFYASVTLVRIEQGAGGAGPAGGGGGGNGGSKSYHETLRFVRVTPTAVPTPTQLPPVPPVLPKVQAPTPVIPPMQQPVVRSPEQPSVPAPMQTISSTNGAGPGSGRDGTAGNGPGSGGGIGSGIGPGRGSGIGPGTGGGTQANYPPQPIEFFLPPLPPPASVRGFKFIAEFDVDSTGHVIEYTFSPTRDGDYNRRIASILKLMRFRPGTRPDGTPLRMKAQVGYEF
jgi:protein TonB